MHMNNDRMLAAAHSRDIVVNELHEANPKIISMAETISRSLSAIILKAINVANLNPFVPKKYRSKYICEKVFDRCLIFI